VNTKRHFSRRRFFFGAIAVVLAAAALALLGFIGRDRVSQGQGATDLEIANVQANAATVDRFAKFELTFDVNGSVATYPDWPYDPVPPPGVPAGVGISVEALFSDDDWATTVVQPGFRYQDYQRDCVGAEQADFCQYWDGQE
jgi:hypothetical protein